MLFNIDLNAREIKRKKYIERPGKRTKFCHGRDPKLSEGLNFKTSPEIAVSSRVRVR